MGERSSLLGKECRSKTGGSRRSLLQFKYGPELLRVDVKKGLTFSDIPIGVFQTEQGFLFLGEEELREGTCGV